MRAAIRAGADAVYFGVQGFNARARAANFQIEDLPQTLDELHTHRVKGYVTLNTLVFDHELDDVERVIRAVAAAGADAIIVQDIGLCRLAAQVAPSLPIHASTQMTCTDAASVNFAASLGARRVVLARELSLEDIARIRAQTDTELEVFVHGALCVSYSGQCLTSEAIGGRSANRGACAQACRLPYELIVDGQVHDVGERAYLLSPQDLDASTLTPHLSKLGIASLKIEGRLKGPEYVGAVTRMYRAALDDDEERRAMLRKDAMIAYSRGSGVGFLGGTDHQQLVEGRTCEHRGLFLGEVLSIAKQGTRHTIDIQVAESISRGDGVVIEGGRAGAGELGGRIWEIWRGPTPQAQAEAQTRVQLWLGPDVDLRSAQVGQRVFLNSSPSSSRNVLHSLAREPYREAIDVVIAGEVGGYFELTATSERGRSAQVRGDAHVEQARSRPLVEHEIRAKLERLGDTPFRLRDLVVKLPPNTTVPVSALNRARRDLVAALYRAGERAHPVSAGLPPTHAQVPKRPLPGGLYVLCRTEEQAVAAHEAGAAGLYLDFLALTGMGRAYERLRARGVPFIGVAPPRIRKPGEEKIDRFLSGLAPDAVLVRGLGALHELSAQRQPQPHSPLLIGDFSLNIANRIAAREVLARGLDAFTPSFDLNGQQLLALLKGELARAAELVIHHPMPLFHMEHCVFAALLSEGKDYKSCGRPCETHQLSLRDRVGLDNPVEADVGCRNTVFHAQAQSAAGQVGAATRAGCQRFRIELVRETPADVHQLVTTYRRLWCGEISSGEAFQSLRAKEGYGVVRGSLRVL